MFYLQAIADFVTSWPILAIPAFFILDVFSAYARKLGLKEPRLLFASLPGFVIAWAWYSFEGISLDPGDILGTLIIAPTNVASPLIFIYSIVENCSLKNRNGFIKVSKKIELSLFILLMFLYLYEQLLIIVARQAAD